MEKKREIDAVAEQITAATSFSTIFGQMPAGDHITKRSGLRKKFAYLAQIVHPDHVPEHDREVKQLAARTFDALNTMRQNAEEAIRNGAYDRPFAQGAYLAPAEKGAEMRSAKGSYKLSNIAIRTGDFSALYRGVTGDAKQRPILVKVSLEPTNNSWLEKEAVILSLFRDAPPAHDLVGLRPYVPELIDTFLVRGEGNRQFRALVLNAVPDMVSVAQIIEAYPRGLDPKDAAWVSRRIIAQAIAARMADVVHAGIVPDHILVDPFKHEPLHIGWAHALKKGERVTHILERWRDLYPPEVFAKKVPSHASDIYMAGKTIIRLYGGDVQNNTFPPAVPKEIAQVLLRAVESSPARRFGDAMQFLDEFTRVVRKLWGRGYRPLTMPVH